MRDDILERKADILKWIAEDKPKCYMCVQLKCKQETLNKYLKDMNIKYAGNQGRRGHKEPGYKPASTYMHKNSKLKGFKLKVKLFREGIKQQKCELCGLTEWLGHPIPLEIHHKDCDKFNNELSNLQILCPNCHALQDGNSGANVGRYASIAEQE